MEDVCRRSRARRYGSVVTIQSRGDDGERGLRNKVVRAVAEEKDGVIET